MIVNVSFNIIVYFIRGMSFLYLYLF